MRIEVAAEALEHLVRGIVDNPDDVKVVSRRAGRGRGQGLNVYVNQEDMGRVIGRSGRTATALRTTIGALDPGSRLRIDFVDTDER